MNYSLATGDLCLTTVVDLPVPSQTAELCLLDSLFAPQLVHQSPALQPLFLNSIP